MAHNRLEAGYTLKLGPVPQYNDLLAEIADRFRNDTRPKTSEPIHMTVFSAAEKVIYESPAHPASLLRVALLHTSLPDEQISEELDYSKVFAWPFTNPIVAQARDIIGFDVLYGHPDTAEIQEDRIKQDFERRQEREAANRGPADLHCW